MATALTITLVEGHRRCGVMVMVVVVVVSTVCPLIPRHQTLPSPTSCSCSQLVSSLSFISIPLSLFQLLTDFLVLYSMRIIGNFEI